jgi:RNA polymerase sigma-70 factor (sigma-E family)
MGTADEDFETFFRTRAHALLRTAYLLTGDRHRAEDLVQETFARTHRAWRRLGEEINPEAYARQVMYHLQVSWWRRRRVPESLYGDMPEPRHGADHSGDTVNRVALRRALMRLTPHQRAVVVMRYFEDRTEADIAETLGCRVGTVKSHAARALAALRLTLPDQAGFPTAPAPVPKASAPTAGGPKAGDSTAGAANAEGVIR